jgi:hypothetical protein
MAVLGMETSSGDFEVIDLCFAGLPDIYTPKASTSANGKGKAKAKDTEMELDGTSTTFGQRETDEQQLLSQARHGSRWLRVCRWGRRRPQQI